jgi:hypothetical protein
MPMTAKVLVVGLLLTCGVVFGANVKVCNGIPCATITDLGGGKYVLDVNATVTAVDLTTAAKGATAAGSPTSTAGGADRQMLDVLLRDSTGAEIPANANGQATMANSAPVVIASDQASVGVTRVPAGRTRFQCTFSGTATANMTCTPAGPSGAALYYHITDVWLGSQSAQTVKLVDSATSGCGAGTTDLTPATYLPACGQGGVNLTVPIKSGAANTYLCVVPGTGGASNTATGVVVGWIAP